MRGPDWPRSMRKSVDCKLDFVKLAPVVAERSRPFENQDMLVHLYLRHSDLRARILCRSSRSSRPKLCCLPLSGLKANRSDSCIQLRKPSPSGRLDLWANLRFTTYERESFSVLVKCILTYNIVRHDHLLLHLSCLTVPGPP